MDRLADIVTRYAAVVLGLSVLLTVFAISRIVDLQTGERHLTLDPSVDRLIPEADEGKAYYDHVREVFGSDQTLLVALVADDIFSPDVLASVIRMTERIEKIRGVHHVVSLSTALNIRSEGEEIEIEAFLLEPPASREAAERIRREVLASPVYAGNLVSRDSTATALLVHFLDMSEREFGRRGIDAAITAIAEEERGEAEILITGQPHIKVATSQTLLSDLRRTMPLVIGVVALVALAFFRTLRGAFVPLLTVLVALIWTLGAIAWLGRSLNLVTIIVPPLILVIGFAYGVHIVAAYYEALREGPGGPADAGPMRRGLARVAMPVLLAGLTTIVGFLSLTLSRIGAIREFGLFSVIGLGCLLLASMSFAPALLQLLPTPRGARAGAPRTDMTGFERAAEWLARFDLRHRTTILSAGGALAVVSLLGVAQLRVTSDMIQNFPDDSAVRLDFEAVNQRLEGANQFYVVVETDIADAFTDPENLRQLEALQGWLDAQPEIGGTTSLVDYVALINRGFNEGDPAYLAIPESQEMTEQLLMFGGTDELWNFVDRRYRTANILVRSTVLDSSRLGDLIARIEAHVAELPPHLRTRITGNSILMTRAIDEIARGQVESLSTALLVIYVILALMFTSARIGLVALIPNALPVLAFFGIMGFSGVTLTATTSLIACIVLGIAVDDSIHYMAHFNADSKRLASEQAGTSAALRAVLRPVTVTTVAICLGFSMLMFSELRNQVHFGGLGAAALALAWLLDVTLTPALCSRLRIVSLWDALTLDLGPQPQASIPLFHDLSATQARKVALLTSVRSFSGGTRIVSEGEAGDEMYVVIDGELDASVQHGAERVQLERLGRGSAFGDIALFYSKRTADVDARTDVRLLRLSKSSLDRLSRRYPRIALKVLRNLSQILAERVARQTGQLR